MAIPLSEVVTKMQARILAQVSGTQGLARLEHPRESPNARAHKGIRVWPSSTAPHEQYSDTAVNWYRDTIEVDVVYKLGRDVATGRTAALDLEESVIQAVTDRTWYAETSTWSVTDAIEVQVGDRSREVEGGWIVTSINLDILRQESL